MSLKHGAGKRSSDSGSLNSRYKKQEQRNKWQEVTAGAMAAAVAVGNRQSAVGKRNIKH